jgi:hypothetical protein
MYSGRPVKAAMSASGNIEVGRANRVTDGFALLDDRRVILRVGAVERVLSLARVVVLAALVEKNFARSRYGVSPRSGW